MRTVIVLLVVAFSLPSCATIVARGPDQVIFNSRPSGAMVSVDGVQIGKTPVVGPVSRMWHKGIVRMELAGHEPHVQQVPRTFNGWIVGNIVFGGVIGILIDLGTANCRSAVDVMAVDLATGKLYLTRAQREANAALERSFSRMQ